MIPFLHGVFATNGGVASDFELIETQTVGAGGAASVTFSSIPGTYKHLQVRAIVRDTNTGGAISWLSVAPNGATTGMNNHFIVGDGSSASSNYENLGSKINFGGAAANGATANVFGAFICDLLDYRNTSKNKTFRFLDGCDNNGTGNVALASGLWQSTTAVTSLTFAPGGGTFVQYSTFSLYGVK